MRGSAVKGPPKGRNSGVLTGRFPAQMMLAILETKGEVVAKKGKKPKKITHSPEELKRARGVAAGLEASFTDPPPPAAMAPAPLLDEIGEMGEAGVAGMLEHLAATNPEGRLPMLRAFRELRNPAAVPGLLAHAVALRWSPEELFALRETVQALDPKAELPLELDGDAIARVRKAAEQMGGGSFSLDAADAAIETLESLPPRLQEMALRQGLAGEDAESAPGEMTEKMLRLAEAYAGRGLGPPVVLIDALASMETPEAAEVLSKLGETVQDKKTGSQIRKALYRLQGKGVVVKKEPVEMSGGGEASPQGLDYVKAVVSATDGTGTFLVWMARSRQPRGRSLFQVRVRFGRGIEEFIASDVSSKELRDFFGRLSDESKLSTAEVAPGYAFWLLQQAQKENESGGAPLPSGFTHSKLLLAPLADPKVFPPDGLHPARTAVQPWGGDDQRVTVPEMFAHPAFWTWVLEEELMLPHFQKCVESFQSQVAVDDAQRRQLFDSAVEDSAKELYGDGDLRERLVRQLECNAYVLERVGQGNLARESLTLADELGAGSEQPGFFSEMIRYTIGVMLDRAIRESQAAQGHAHEHDHEHGEGGDSPVIVAP